MSQQNDLRRRIQALARVFLGIPLLLLSFYFLARILLAHQEKVMPYLGKLNGYTLAVSILLFFAYFGLRGWVWQKLLEREGYTIDTGKTFLHYHLSEIKRYTPGNVFSFLARITSFTKFNVPKSLILKLLLVEVILLVVSASLLSIPALLLFVRMPMELKSILILLVLCIVFSGGFITIRVKKMSLSRLVSLFSTYIDVFFLLLLAWFFFGLAHFFVLVSFTEINPSYFFALVSLFVWSWLGGYLSFVTPMGLGVREALTTLGLSIVVPSYVASAVSISARLILIVSELCFLLCLLLYQKIKRLKLLRISLDTHVVFLGFFVVSYIAYFTYVSFEKHLTFFTGKFDLGNMDQTVWNTIHGRVFTLTNPDGVEVISRLAIHADVILIVLSPLYLLWEDPRMLLLVQTILCASGAFFVYKLAVLVLKEKNLALALSLSYLLNPFLQKQNLYEFHAVSLATTFLLACFFYLAKNRYIPFLIFLFLAFLTKENVYLIGTITGLYLFLVKKKKIGGAVLASVSFLAFVLLVGKFMPEARGGHHFALSYFQEFGASPFSIAKNILLQPHKTASYLFTLENGDYLKNLFLPVGFLSLLAPGTLLFTLPDLALNLLSNNHNLKSINFHYTATILPFLYISSVYGIKRLILSKKYFLGKRMVFYYILATSLYSAWLLGPLPFSRYPSIEIFTQKIAYREEVREFLRNIPPHLSVSATNNLGAHLSHREKLYTIPYGLENADVVAFLLTDTFAQPSLGEQLRMVEKLRHNSSYQEVFQKEAFVVFTPNHNAPLVRARVSQITRSDIPQSPDRKLRFDRSKVVGSGFTKKGIDEKGQL